MYRCPRKKPPRLLFIFAFFHFPRALLTITPPTFMYHKERRYRAGGDPSPGGTPARTSSLSRNEQVRLWLITFFPFIPRVSPLLTHITGIILGDPIESWKGGLREEQLFLFSLYLEDLCHRAAILAALVIPVTWLLGPPGYSGFRRQIFMAYDWFSLLIPSQDADLSTLSARQGKSLQVFAPQLIKQNYVIALQ